MAFSVTGFQAYALPTSEPGEQNFVQCLTLSVAGTTADVALDFGSYVAGSLGTFWTAAGGSGTGATALAYFQSVLPMADHMIGWGCWELQAGFKPAGGASVGAGLYKQGGTAVAPTFTLNASEGLTAYTFVFKYKMKKDVMPVRYGV